MTRGERERSGSSILAGKRLVEFTADGAIEKRWKGAVSELQIDVQPRVSGVDLLGRERELDQARHQLEENRAVAISGEEGTGKTAFLLTVGSMTTLRDGALLLNVESLDPEDVAQAVFNRFFPQADPRILIRLNVPPETAGLRALILLDDADGTFNVDVLEKAFPDCRFLMAYRGVRSDSIVLHGLNAEQSLRLFRRNLAGERRITEREHSAARALIEVTEGRPAWLLVAAEFARRHADKPLEELVPILREGLQSPGDEPLSSETVEGELQHLVVMLSRRESKGEDEVICAKGPSAASDLGAAGWWTAWGEALRVVDEAARRRDDQRLGGWVAGQREVLMGADPADAEALEEPIADRGEPVLVEPEQSQAPRGESGRRGVYPDEEAARKNAARNEGKARRPPPPRALWAGIGILALVAIGALVYFLTPPPTAVLAVAQTKNGILLTYASSHAQKVEITEYAQGGGSRDIPVSGSPQLVKPLSSGTPRPVMYHLVATGYFGRKASDQQPQTWVNLPSAPPTGPTVSPTTLPTTLPPPTDAVKAVSNYYTLWAQSLQDRHAGRTEASRQKLAEMWSLLSSNFRKGKSAPPKSWVDDHSFDKSLSFDPPKQGRDGVVKVIVRSVDEGQNGDDQRTYPVTWHLTQTSNGWLLDSVEPPSHTQPTQ